MLLLVRLAKHSTQNNSAMATVDLAMPGEYLVFRNARTDMFRGSMRLAVNQWGKVEAAEPNQDFQVKVSLVIQFQIHLLYYVPVMFIVLPIGGRKPVSN